jgi:two-component system nitrogen regulation response regulator NtrX
MTGLELLSKIRAEGGEQGVIVMSGMGSIDVAVEAVRLGALDFVQKPIDVERLRVSVRNALKLVQLRSINEELLRESDATQELLGASPIMVRLRDMIRRVASSDGRVLILGENGTGKELVANAVHRGSPRRENAFIKVNCGALPENLVESELFGHEKGAFTGASSRRKGRFELADGGTLFLDEIGELSLDLQVKLLRVIQEGQFERVGGSQTLSVDVRLIAATNRDLPRMIEKGEFREDLYYRLNVVALKVPPLRERREDIPLLVENMIRRRPVSERPILGEEVCQKLMARNYPGNVRELQNIVERLGIFFPGREVTVEDIQELAPGYSRAPSIRPPVAQCSVYQRGVSYRERLNELERSLIAEALSQFDNNKVAAAEALGTDKSFFYRKCRQFGLG